MTPIVEAVPNFSEGRAGGFLDEVAASFTRAGCDVLHTTADVDHNRSVVTVIGSPKAVEDGSVVAAQVAVRAIDMRLHRGVHPRVGALDVLPFVPLRGVTMEETVRIARRAGARIARLGVPVYFYGYASDPAGRGLAEIRRGGFERLSDCERGTSGEWRTDKEQAEGGDNLADPALAVDLTGSSAMAPSQHRATTEYRPDCTSFQSAGITSLSASDSNCDQRGATNQTPHRGCTPSNQPVREADLAERTASAMARQRSWQKPGPTLEADLPGQVSGATEETDPSGVSSPPTPTTYRFTHPRAGATCVGARNLLLAWNVDLVGVSHADARKIAARIRETGGGFAGLRALALYLPSQSRLQIAMNLEAPAVTDPRLVFEAINDEAVTLGGRPGGTEVVGMLPDELSDPALACDLGIRDWSISRLLSRRISVTG